ncbi:MAG: hypothetical protein JWO69_1049 [Thermoleophilia bacterium]|nr:hypothetical protein [Thermoleophilia bacterium]
MHTDTQRPTDRGHGPQASVLLLTVLVVLVAGLAVWRFSDADPERTRAAAGAAAEATPTMVRRWSDAGITLPRGWVVLDRARDHVTWGSSDRSHTVTLAATEASVLPLPGVVAAVARDAPRSLPGSRVVGAPTQVELDGRTARGDAAFALELEVDSAGAALHLLQVWRRDARAERDLVATWTSNDGRWPIDPLRSVPGPNVR